MCDIDDLNVKVAGAVLSLFIQSADECRCAVDASISIFETNKLKINQKKNWKIKSSICSDRSG